MACYMLIMSHLHKAKWIYIEQVVFVFLSRLISDINKYISIKFDISRLYKL
jgi:hypothetical protein